MRPRRRLGQHFLDPSWADRLVDLIEPRPTDGFLEVGAGRGALTLPLARRAGHVTAVEIDSGLAAGLAPHLPGNVRLVTGDVLALDLSALLHADRREDGRLRVAGNLPYSVAVPILFRLLAVARDVPDLADATLMVQREVAERLTARPGTRDYGVLTVFVRVHADVSELLRLPPGAFRPAPKVASTAVRLTFRPPLVVPVDPQGFERLVRGIFTQRRKTMLNALKPLLEGSRQSSADALAKADIDPRRRPETLEVSDLARLADILTARPR